MGALRALSGREVGQILGQHGFMAVRQRGSHMVMQKREAGTTLTVPVPDQRTLRVGTLLSIIRQSGLPRSLFESD